MAISNVGTDRDLFGINIKVLKYAALWNPFSTFYKRMFYNFYTIFVVVLIIENGLLLYIDMFKNLNNIIIIADGLHILITITCNSTKMIYFLINNKRVKLLINRLNEGLFPGISTFSEVEIRAKKRSYYLTVIIVGAGLFSAFASYLKVGFSLYYFDLSSVPLNETEPFMALLRIRQWYPRSWWFNHYVLVSLHGTIGVMSWGPLTDMGHDCLIATFLIHTACQFEMIQQRISDYDTKLQLDDRKRYDLLRKCLIFHQTALKYNENVFINIFNNAFNIFLIDLPTICNIF